MTASSSAVHAGLRALLDGRTTSAWSERRTVRDLDHRARGPRARTALAWIGAIATWPRGGREVAPLAHLYQARRRHSGRSRGRCHRAADHPSGRVLQRVRSDALRHSTALDAPEAQVAGGRVDGLLLARGGAVAQAVV